MPFSVHLEGNGVAAACCARLLEEKNIRATTTRTGRPALPAVLLNTATARLLRDVFPELELATSSQIIRTRVVRWGVNATPISMPHAGFVISEQALLDKLWNLAPAREMPTLQRADWRVFSTSDAFRDSGLRTLHGFGTRVAALAEVRLRSDTDTHTCWIESLDEGWLFLLPNASGAAMLIVTGTDPGRLLGDSQLIGPLVAGLSSPWATTPAYPRIADPVCAPGWLACGSAALSFDPICGEGTGHAVREAILAAAVLCRLQSAGDGDAAALLHHFFERMVAGFRKHLEACRGFYESGGDTNWWTTELQHLDAGIDWTRRQLSFPTRPPFRLVGFDLQPLPTAAL